MARPQKEGFDYFPITVNIFSEQRFRTGRRKFGSAIYSFYTYILCCIYGGKGYYTEIENEEDFFTAVYDDTGIDDDTVRDMLKYLFSRNILDEDLFTAKKVLTAADIQRVYQEIRKNAKRDILVDDSIWLLKPDETRSFIKFSAEECFSGNNSDKSGKNDIKESKEKENKVKDSKAEESKAEESKEMESKAASLKPSAQMPQPSLPPQQKYNSNNDVFKEYTEKIEHITPYRRNDIEQWLTKVDKDVFLYAVREADESCHRSWKYVNAVLKNHYNSGRTTMAQINEHNMLYKKCVKGGGFNEENMCRPREWDTNIHNPSVSAYDFDAIIRRMNEREDEEEARAAAIRN